MSNKCEVDYAYIAAKCRNASTQFSGGIWGDIKFPFLMAKDKSEPFAFTLSFGPKEFIAGDRALWLFCGQGQNHGQILVKHHGVRVGIVNNRLPQAGPNPVPRLVKVGDVTVSGTSEEFVLVGFNKEGQSQNAELGLLVLAPREMNSQQILQELSGPNPGADTILLLLFLASTFCLALLVASEADSGSKLQARNPLIWGALLVYVLSFPVLGQRQIQPSPLVATGSQSDRSGMEGVIANGLADDFQFLWSFALKTLPSREQDDVVPKPLRVCKGSLPTEIYATSEKISPVVSDHIFNGKLKQVQTLPAETFRRWACGWLIAIGAAILVDALLACSWSLVASLALIGSLSIFLSLRLSAGWDEFFINLRHAEMWVQHGVYSVNAKSMVEGTVDFLPLATTALLGFMGLDLVNAFLCLSLLGNIGVIVFAYLLARHVTGNRSWGLLAALALGIFPNVIWVGATGFSAVLFSAWMLGAIYFLVFKKHKAAGLFFLSTLTLVRTEGFFFSVLLLAYVDLIVPGWAWFRGRAERSQVLGPLLKDGAVVALPFLLSLIVRKVVFGSPIPTPIPFKNSHLDNVFFCSGLNRLAEMVATYDLLILALACALLALAVYLTGPTQPDWSRRRGALNHLLLLNPLMLLIILPYYTGGGDWLPSSWNRYGLPFNLFLVLTGVILLAEAFPKNWAGWRRLSALVVFPLAFSVGYLKACKFRAENFLNLAKTDLASPEVFEPWKRVDQLAALGSLLRSTLPADAVVASPEEATIMYFAQREMLGLLGVSNPEMLSMPFQPRRPGEIVHRKRAYLSVCRHRPDVIALYEPILKADLEGAALTKQHVKTYLQEGLFNQEMVDIGYYRVGSYEALQKMGYRHFTICYANELFSIFVGQKVQEAFLQALSAKGFTKLGEDSIDYSVSPDICGRFLPAAPEILSALNPPAKLTQY